MAVDFQNLEQRRSSLDTSGMLDLTTGFPSQMNDAWNIGAEFARKVDNTSASRVVVCGMGGSAIGGDMVRSFFGDGLRVPVLVNRSYDVAPSLIDGGLFIFSSYSGNTGETLSAYDAVRGSGRPMLAITGGGRLAERCAEDRVPVCTIPGGMPPRAAIAYSFFPLMHTLSALGLADGVAKGEYDEAHDTLGTLCQAYRAAEPNNHAASLADEVHGKLALIYSGSGLFEAVARRWVTQINENSKSLAHFALLPELTHNEIVGWDALKEIRNKVAIIHLVDPDDGAMARKQAEIAIEIIGPHAGSVHEVTGGDGGRLSRILSAMILGDFVSVYLAFLNNVDPTPVKNIDALKSRLR